MVTGEEIFAENVVSTIARVIFIAELEAGSRI